MISLMMLFIFNVHATVSIEDCHSMANEQGDGRGEFKFEKNCYALIKAKAKKHKHFKSKNTIYGKDNIIFIEKEGKEYLWAGSETGVEKVHFVHLDEEAKRVLVIANEPKQILTFDLNLPGNVAPINKLTDGHTATAVSVAIDSQAKRLLVIGDDGKIVIYRQDARDDGRRKENLKKPLALIQGSKTKLISPISIIREGKKKRYLVLDPGAGGILYFSTKTKGNKKPLKLRKLKSSSKYNRLEFESATNKIIIRGQSGKVYKIR
ncbi:MAG: hypothetical protein KC493_13440 [Bacteriovoracaceae bacterium]|nr:hypothetical protein [Bacteriovoracaceae bacterium]